VYLVILSGPVGKIRTGPTGDRTPVMCDVTSPVRRAHTMSTQQVKAKVTETKAIPVGGRRFAAIGDQGQ
jgi:hypothetical protein